jgi:molecular chaperone GrpE
MRSGWEKMTRWAGIGHNESDAEKLERDEPMVDEKDMAVTDQDGQSGVETLEAAMENGHPEIDRSAESVELAQVRGERDQLKADIQAMNDRLARLQAEFDNARKREAKERTDAREYTIGSTVEPFLGVMDNFQLALKAQGSLEQLRGGVGLILKQMEEALRGLNVIAVESVGTQFDPRVHEALGSVETAEFPDHQVIEEIRRGYKIREKLLRPAMVKIAVNTAQVSD